MYSRRPPSDRQLVPPKYKVHRCILINDYSEFLIHVVEFQTTIAQKQCLVLLVSLFFRNRISLIGSSSTSVAHTS